ncbi:MAG: 1-(5-phosphoribosyl)-5-[(5-phosphoribosylamino)methylideneamino]imidazole-4-carboxamide isomerase [Leptospirillia bacterium]
MIPAIDLKEGQCVRLKQGRMEDATIYGDDPAEQARRWADCGATWLHVVDLDGAFAGVPKNLSAITDIVNAVGMKVEVGGGIRDMERAKAYLDAGVERIILGSAAVKNPELVPEMAGAFPGRVVVGIDAVGGRVAVSGWAEVTEVDAARLATRMASCNATAIIYTDIGRDGMQTGTNVEATRQVAKACGIPVIASGGVSTLDHIRELLGVTADGVAGVVVGRSIYEGTLDLAEALALAAEAA